MHSVSLEKYPTEIKAIFTYMVHKNEENGFSIAVFKNIDTRYPDLKKFTCTGNFLPDIKNYAYKLNGSWKNNASYGIQFQVTSAEEEKEQNRDGIVEYLSSGLIKGVGKVTAERIYERFGKDSISTLDKNPNELLQVKGISKQRLEKIIHSYKESKVASELIQVLSPFGISPSISYKLYSEYGSESLAYVKNKTYDLSYIRGIGFQIADQIAMSFNYPINSKDRLDACALYLLRNNESSTGGTYMNVQLLGSQMLNVLKGSVVSKDVINQHVIQMIKDKSLKFVKIENGTASVQCVCRPVTFQSEYSISKDVKRILNQKPKKITSIDKDIIFLESEYCITLGSFQKNAIQKSLDSSISVITGGPGTGKTMIINFVAAIYQKHYKSNQIVLMAPTGRAAKEMTKSTGKIATTIHKKLGLRDSESLVHDKTFVSSEDVDLIEDSLVIIDETSMLDIWVAQKTFESIGSNCIVILVGDVDQLPSVEAGAVLKDIIDSNIVPVSRLEEVFRQDESSEIVKNSIRMKKGLDVVDGSDFVSYELNSLRDIHSKMIDIYIHSLNKYSVDQIACLCPQREGYAGVYEMNREIQNKINPKKGNDLEYKVGQRTYRVNDIVMQLKNTDVLANGDIGVVTSIYKNEEHSVMEVTYKDMNQIIKQEYTSTNIGELELAYAMTVHKAQGSEYPCVITSLSREHASILVKRNLPYTAITRAKEELHLLGDRNTLLKAICNTNSDKRNTLLCYHLQSK